MLFFLGFLFFSVDEIIEKTVWPQLFLQVYETYPNNFQFQIVYSTGYLPYF